uniref:type I protein arginine methyltransferase n=1 Tax=Aplanochytrium stocchinoi TaxID=215587 RepID=A0A6S8B372_9STRA|mmetsp:Transcript_17310/g.21300  ORF Transcript_17310/g.21300 Transcript_17310/m.21300 type:complete len:577 (-) Transcript_17310:635-2365(-)|eukprot:CAMPEP_0204835822 /NCGR_PEP_ID=MMETSP1346-20131115/23716_1 /ASSEMBLY_ACC=CAM_ASM_000771 /TAXON_ID=215587 /ORGANISM="Aplanochytrium stocchinoi, Strain GSBS06" /LENGTH=576 /DNA_ID=CAMNT_0051970153 /DNA_START=80 /DNA_END=1810 /DNA_ORIENTATION=-
MKNVSPDHEQEEYDEDDGLSEDENWLMEDESNDTRIKDLFNPEEISHGDLKSLLERSLNECNFDLKKIASIVLHNKSKSYNATTSTEGMDSFAKDEFDSDYRILKLLNYIRFRTIKQHMRDSEILRKEIIETLAFDDNKFLSPVVPDDPLLYLFQDMYEHEQEEAGERFEDTLKKQREEINSLKAQLEECRKKLTESLIDVDNEGTRRVTVTTKKEDDNDKIHIDSDYFDSYSTLSIHREMLQDRPRTLSYRDALEKVSKGKKVMDIGCGTGILCLFAARAGAEKVIGIDAAEIIHQAVKIIKDNKYDNKVNLVKGKLEDLDLNSMQVLNRNEKIDVLVSEWMGYGLLFESMLDSVLVARDRFLDKETGIMVPSHASIFVQACDKCEAKHFQFWNDVYGFDYSAIKEMDVKEHSNNDDKKNHSISFAHVGVVDHSSIISSRALAKEFDLIEVDADDLDFAGDFTIKINEIGENEDKNKTFQFNSVVISFDCAMSPGITLSTATDKPYTHWQQTMLVIEDSPKDPKFLMYPGEEISGTLSYQKSDTNQRNIIVSLSLNFPQRFGYGDTPFEKIYELS